MFYFYYYKCNININKIVVSNKFSFGKQDFKYFNDKKTGPLCIFFWEMRIYKKYSDKTKFIYFIIKDKTKFIKIWQFGRKLAI